VSGDGELARVLQHETGHLRGELFIDGLDRRERAQILREFRDRAS
jgi:peptide deformylase